MRSTRIALSAQIHYEYHNYEKQTMKNHILIAVIADLATILTALWPVPVDRNKASSERRPPMPVLTVGPHFPIAFSVRATQNVNRIAKLLQQIYRPQNLYCIHVDRSATFVYNASLQEALAEFGENVFFVPDGDRVAMDGGKVALLEADLVCAKLLKKRSSEWRYWINLSGGEIPLKTNWEIVTALQLLNGSNAVSAYIRKTKSNHPTPQSYLDLNVTWYQGDDSVAVRPEFVSFVLQNDMATLLLDAFRAYEEDFGPNKIKEGYFAILNNNPSVFAIPGAFANSRDHFQIETPIRAEHRMWHRRPCRSRFWQNSRCLFGAIDVPFLKSHPHFFVDSLAPSFTKEARNELENWHTEKLRHEARTGKLHPSFDKKYYSQLEATKMHL
ncbi:Core-2/I-Branching enzyme [Opisthorchis viverrini]|uniref:Core-2/I-Branching enzyme n=1 Tax=Opisthorchis viverrini TaxID=6198 RepID=A0A1S8WQ88_OPIVI|nr:Core-2/I-Branching enzyme [Opisthorchis viverrini]